MKTFSVGLFLAGSVVAPACDLCAVYNVHAAEGTRNTGFSVGVAQQYTRMGTLQDDGHKVSNPDDQYLNSAISQVAVGYTFNDWASVQVSLPFIHRQFRRAEESGIDRGSETGLGDMSLMGVFTPVRVEHKKSTFNWNVFGGVKLPTGDSSRLKEETEEVEHDGGGEDGHVESGIHGHDLALGSGSVDGLIGTRVYGRYQRVFFRASVQYAIRSRGDYDYRYANDLMWIGGPGVLLVLNERWTAALQCVVSGENKGLDKLGGENAGDTGLTSVYVGPQFNMTWSDKLSAEAGVDLPVVLDNTELQAVPDYRVRASITYRF